MIELEETRLGRLYDIDVLKKRMLKSAEAALDFLNENVCCVTIRRSSAGEAEHTQWKN